MKSVWVAESLRPARRVLLGRDVIERPRGGAAPGDVRGGVLVEQRVAEHDAGLADARRGVHERDLAEAARAVVDGELGAQGVLAAGRARLHDLAARDAQLEALDDRAAQRERHACCGRCRRRAGGAGW